MLHQCQLVSQSAVQLRIISATLGGKNTQMTSDPRSHILQFEKECSAYDTSAKRETQGKKSVFAVKLTPSLSFLAVPWCSPPS